MTINFCHAFFCVLWYMGKLFLEVAWEFVSGGFLTVLRRQLVEGKDMNRRFALARAIQQ